MTDRLHYYNLSVPDAESAVQLAAVDSKTIESAGGLVFATEAVTDKHLESASFNCSIARSKRQQNFDLSYLLHPSIFEYFLYYPSPAVRI